MFFDQRVLFSDDGVLIDVSAELNDFRSGALTLPLVAAEDYLYIGTLLPWSARWFEVGTVNALASVVTVQLYDGGIWWDAVDLVDLTSASGKSLAQSGFIRFLRDRDRSWSRYSESSDIAELAGTSIYDLYWMRLKFSADLTPTMTLKFIGQKFSNDSALYAQYPDLNQAALLSRFATGKTSWDEQHYIAASTILADLKNRRMIVSGDQILDPWVFERAAVHKVAEIIYGAFGDPYANNKAIARKDYETEISAQFKNLDSSQDGTLSLGDRQVTFGKLYR